MKWIKLGDTIFDGHKCDFIQISQVNDKYIICAYHENECTFTDCFDSYDKAKKYLMDIHSALDNYENTLYSSKYRWMA